MARYSERAGAVTVKGKFIYIRMGDEPIPTEAVAEVAIDGRPHPGHWYIQMGFAGFNSPANNRLGYSSKITAESAILRYQSASKK